MLPELKLTISQNDKVIQTITKVVNEQNLVQSLVEFQSSANTVLTKMIEDSGGSAGDFNMDEENDDSDEGEDQEADQVSPMKKKK